MRTPIVALGVAGLVLITLASLWLTTGPVPAPVDRHEAPVNAEASRARETLEAEVPAKAWHASPRYGGATVTRRPDTSADAPFGTGSVSSRPGATGSTTWSPGAPASRAD